MDDILNNRVDMRNKGDWKYVENSLVLKTPVICTTLSMAGISRLDLIRNSVDYLIVDEACQAIEPACLIPFNLNPKRVILVGDQKQLPATTFSDNAIESNFARSLFERLLQSGYQKTMLTIQYRMHPLIRQFPSDKFYHGKITDGEIVSQRKLDNEMHTLSTLMRRSIFFDILSSQEEVRNLSRQNVEETRFTLCLVQFIYQTVCRGQSFSRCLAGKIAVITPYKAQVNNLKDAFGPWLRSIGCQLNVIEINTVDAFQGREKDVVIFNCVRSNDIESLQGSLGFCTDVRRLNVAITRPRHFLFVIGNSETLLKCDTWAYMVYQHRAKQANGGYFALDRDFTSQLCPEMITELLYSIDPAPRNQEAQASITESSALLDKSQFQENASVQKRACHSIDQQ